MNKKELIGEEKNILGEKLELIIEELEKKKINIIKINEKVKYLKRNLVENTMKKKK